MKIVMISNNKKALQEMEQALELRQHTLSLVAGDIGRLHAAAERYQPDLLIVEEAFEDISALSQVEMVASRFPQMAILLACADPTADFLMNAMRAGVRDVLPAPLSAALLEGAANRITARLASDKPQRLGKILAFMSCKGGSGATFLAANLGYQLAESSSVLLIDLDLQFGDALACVHDDRGTATIADVARDIKRLDASLLAACTVRIADNYHILPAPEEPAQAVEVKPEHIDAILDLAVTRYDYVILDLSRAIDAVSIKALDRADRIFPVLQAGLPYLRNAHKLLGVFQSLGYPAEKTELVVNRFEKNGDIGIADIRKALGVATIHTIRNSYKEVTTAISHGDPIPSEAGSKSVARNLSELAQALNGKQEQTSGWFSRLFA